MLYRAPMALVVLFLAALVGCDGTETIDGEVGVTTLAVANQSDQLIKLTFEKGDLGDPTVLATDIPASANTPILRSSGCFGCTDPPSRIASKMTLTLEDGRVVKNFEPVQDSDWSFESTGEYMATYTLRIDQVDVDNATAP